MRVLVIEDYEPVRGAVVQALIEEGYAVDEITIRRCLDITRQTAGIIEYLLQTIKDENSRSSTYQSVDGIKPLLSNEGSYEQIPLQTFVLQIVSEFDERLDSRN